MDFTFQTPTKVEFIYSYGAGFVDAQPPEDTSSDVEMPSTFEVEDDQHQNGTLVDPPPPSPQYDSNASDDGYDDLAISAPLSRGLDRSSAESDELPSTPTSDIPIFFATQPKATPADIEMDMIPLAEEQQFDECNDQYPSPPCSPRYSPISDDEGDDVMVSLQLVPGDSSCSSEGEGDRWTPMSTFPAFLDAEADSEGDNESICDLDAPFVPDSPGDQGPDDTGSPTTAEYHAQFDGDSTEFLKWLDVVALTKGFIPSSINGLALSLGDQKTLTQLLSQYRAWRASVEFPCLPPTPQSVSNSVEPATCLPMPNAMVVNVDLNVEADPRGASGKLHAFKPANEPLKNYYVAWTGSCATEPTNLDKKSLFLDRILRKCEADGVELSEAVWLFQGRMLGICGRLNDLVSATYQCNS